MSDSKTIKKITTQDVANVLDHSLLRPDITVQELIEGCELAKKEEAAEREAKGELYLSI